MSRMDPTLFVHYQVPQQFPYVSADMYNQVFPNSSQIAQPSSFMRSSAQQGLHPSSPRHFYSHNYSRSPAEGYHEESLPSSSSSSLPEPPQEFRESNYSFATTPAAASTYPLEDSIPRNMPWAKEESMGYGHMPSANFEPQLAPHSRYSDSSFYNQNYPGESHYPTAELQPYYESHAGNLNNEPALTAYTTQGEYIGRRSSIVAQRPAEHGLQSVVHSFSGSPRLDAHRLEQPGSPESVYTSGSPHLQYPTTPDDLTATPQFVSMQDVSPSPTVSPDQVYHPLPMDSPHFESQLISGSYVVAEPASPSSLDFDDGRSDSPVGLIRPFEGVPAEGPRKKHCARSDDEDSHAGSGLESGESEREDDGDDGDDDEYHPDMRGPTRSSARRRASAKHADLRASTPPDTQRPRLAPPVPVPNLTKKSRGRRVPTTSVLVHTNGVEKVSRRASRPRACPLLTEPRLQNVRGYKCKVPGCNKCFQRGEHLKRHIRSIHTNEKRTCAGSRRFHRAS